MERETLTRQRIRELFYRQIAELRESPATDDQLANFEIEFGPIPEAVRWFLHDCGGGVIGREWIDGITKLAISHRKFRSESETEDGWTMKDVFIIGWDGFGNPLVVCLKTGKVLMEDHNFGGIHEIAASFEQFLLDGLR